MEIPKRIRYAIYVLVKGLLVATIGTSASLYSPALAQAPVNEQEGWNLPNIQTLEHYSLAENIELSEKQIYKFKLYVETIENGLTYSDFKKLENLIQCESSWIPTVYGDSKKAYSLAQFHEPTFEDFKRWSGYEDLEYKNPEHQLKLLVWAYKNKKMHNWTCWRNADYVATR